MVNIQKDDISLATNKFGEIKSITLSDHMPGIEIKHQQCSAKISLYGGQVLAWQPKNQKPVFWLSDTAQYQQGKAIRGGIPLCWPWFGAYNSEGKQAGNHGFARVNNWKLDKAEISEEGVIITLSLQDDDHHCLSENNVWPYAFKLTQTLFFGQHFKQTLNIKNNTNQLVNYSVALHSYFRVSSPKNISIPALITAKFDDKITSEHFLSSKNVQCDGPVDRVYHSSDVMQIIDPQWQRTINIQTENSQQWVLWNPGKQGAEQMSDIHHGGEKEYLCLEAANTRWQAIDAMEEVSISQKITLTKM